MSDFLSHLIAKNLDGTETLRPRPPGIFEPTKGGGGSLSGEPLHSALAGAFDEPEATGLQDPKTAAGAPVTDDRSGSADQPLGQFTPARMDHVVSYNKEARILRIWDGNSQQPIMQEVFSP